MTDFLVELGTEELPPKALGTLMNAFKAEIHLQLKAKELSFVDPIEEYGTPRRLAVRVNGLAESTAAKDVTIWGPPKSVAFNDGKPTKAAEKFAEANGLAVDELTFDFDGKVEKLIHRTSIAGQPTILLLGDIVRVAISKLPIAKRMRWGATRHEFIRPLHWVVMLFGNEVVKTEILGIETGRATRGHRFHANHDIILANPNEYLEKLENAYVLADFKDRHQKMLIQINAAAERIGGEAHGGLDLQDEVTSLVEWPRAIVGKFEERFLEIPPEALIASMTEHQKYFHVKNSHNKLMPYFITVANIESSDEAQIRAGNERVIRPRLSDAAFFFETDKKTSLESLRERLKTIVFQAQLGTVYDKTERIAHIAKFIASKLNPATTDSKSLEFLTSVQNVKNAERAAHLSKSDLVTNMVGEFDNMQGIAGHYYALNDGENAEVAAAMNEQYLPRFAGDQLPTTTTGAIIALADRLDTISGIFGIGQQPTGSKDPFALRRASIAVLRILVEKNLALDLRELLTFATQQHSILATVEILHTAAKHNNPDLSSNSVVENVLGYMLDRFRAFYEDANIPAEVFQAVTAKQLSQPLDINQRVLAVNEFSKLPQAQALAAANKRVSNILSKQNASSNAVIHSDLLKEEAEINLARAISAKAELVTPLFDKREYTKALAALADLQQPVDAFFDSVMVMTEDTVLQQNRLALLQQLRALFLEVADISYLVPAKN